MTFRPICVPCRREMRCRENDYLFLEHDGEAVWAGDKYGCENCGAEIVVGFGKNPVRVKGEDGWLTYRVKARLELTRE